VLATGPAIAVVVLWVATLAVAGVVVWRADRRGEATMAIGASATLAVVVTAMATSPINTIGIAAHQFRWLWAAAAFASAAGVTLVLGAVRRQPAQRVAVAGLTVLVAVAVVAVVADGRPPGTRPASDLPQLPQARALVGDLAALEGRGAVLFDPSTLSFGEPYSGLLFAEMQDRGVPFVFDDEGLIRQFGEGRRDDGSARLRLWEVQGEAARDVPRGAERVGFAEGRSGPVALFVEPIG
jgi:hypothetical protein